MKTLGVMLTIFALGLLAAAVLAQSGAGSTADTLTGNVGPGYTISLKQNGAAVTHLAPGTYTITVTDQADLHDFHLAGPGVDQATDVEGTGTTTWTVTLVDGVYTFKCDVHPTQMIGRFTVGNASTSTSTTTTSTASSTSPLAAHIGKVKAAKTSVRASVSASKSGRATLGLYRAGKRLAQKSGSIGSAARSWTLRPAHSLKPGRYTLRLKVAAAGATASASKQFTLK